MCRTWKQRRGRKCLSALLWSHPPKAWAELSLLSWCSRTSSKHRHKGGKDSWEKRKVQGREPQRLIPDQCISVSPGGCGLACLYLWLCGCVWLPWQTGQKKLWWTGEKPALQPLCLTGLTARLSGPLAMGSVSHLWTFWAIRRWSQFFSQCGYWLSRVFLKNSHGMFPCSVHTLLHL